MDNYGGETYRPVSHRFDEHYFSAANQSAKSYLNKPLAKHYAKCHTNMTPELEIKIIDSGKNLKNRKIKKAKFISQKQPSLNDKQELNDLTQFLV